MHSWGSGFKYFAEVDQAAEEIGNFCRKWGRIDVRQTKEKWGTARVYCSFGLLTIQSVLKPGYYYTQKPAWLMGLGIPAWISNQFLPYQLWIYRLAYKRTLRKHPYIRNEILGGADWSEYLEGL